MVELRNFGEKFLRTASKRRKRKTVRYEKASCLAVFLCAEGDRFWIRKAATAEKFCGLLWSLIYLKISLLLL
jgi:hypothetical protein